MKKIMNITAVILSALLVICTAAFTVCAEDTEDVILISAPPIATTQSNVCTSGEIVKVEEEGRILVKVDSGELILNTDEATKILNDALAPITADKLETGMKFTAVHSAAVTRSIPPQTYASLIIVSDSDEKLPICAVIASADTDKDGIRVITTADGNYTFNITEKTEVAPLLTKNILTSNDLSAGDTILVYVNMLTFSIPAIGTPSKVVVVTDIAEDTETDAVQDEKTIIPSKVSTTVIFSEKLSDTQLSVKSGEEEIVLNIDENTFILGSDLMPKKADDLKVGDTLIAIHSSAMTMSLPPQTYAYYIIAADESAPLFAIVDTVSEDKDGTVTVTSVGGAYEFTVNTECSVEAFRTKNIVTAADISKGDELLVYVKDGAVTLSLPSRLAPERVVILKNAVELDIYTDENGVKYVPLRAVCDELGLEVLWNGETRSVSVGSAEKGVTLTIGENAYTVAKAAPQTLEGAPILISDKDNVGFGVTYVPATLFTEILNSNIEDIIK